MKLTKLVALSAIFSTCAFAQDAPKPDAPARPGRGGPGATRTMPPEMIKEYDKDGDGKLSDTERTAMMEAMKAKREAQMKADLEQYDAYKDGKLDEAETKTMRETKQKAMMEKYDTDKDGKLSDEERAKIPASERMMSWGGRGGAGGGRPGGRGGAPGGAPGTPPPAAPPADK
jgi:hypothetical protein